MQFVRPGPAREHALLCAAVLLHSCGSRSQIDELGSSPAGAAGAMGATHSGREGGAGAEPADVAQPDSIAGSCPSGLPGPAMVPAGAFALPTMCIDATEVTNAHYAAFLASSPAPGSGPGACTWNVRYEPLFHWPPPPERAAFPVVDVDWCDAFAYCAWAGKRLCGDPGGGPGS
jgi:hypothetical protein